MEYERLKEIERLERKYKVRADVALKLLFCDEVECYYINKDKNNCKLGLIECRTDSINRKETTTITLFPKVSYTIDPNRWINSIDVPLSEYGVTWAFTKEELDGTITEKTPIRELFLKHNKECTLEQVINSEKGNTRLIICLNGESIPAKEYGWYLNNKVEIIEYEDDDGYDEDGRSIILTEWVVNILL